MLNKFFWLRQLPAADLGWLVGCRPTDFTVARQKQTTKKKNKGRKKKTTKKKGSARTSYACTANV